MLVRGHPLFQSMEARLSPRHLLILMAAAICLTALEGQASAAVADGPWMTNGIRVAPTGSTQSDPVIASDGIGGAIVAWQDGRLHYSFAQHLTSLGSVESGWPGSGLELSPTDGGYDHFIVPDGTGGALVTWKLVAETVVQRVTAAGTIAPGWPQSGVIFQPFKLGQMGNILPVVVADSAGGAFATWENSGKASDQVLVARITPDGTLAPGWVGIGNSINQYSFALSIEPVACGDDAGGVIVAWFDGMQVRTQHLTRGGAIVPGWSGNGDSICTVPGHQNDLGIVSDGTGGAIVVWEDDRNGSFKQVYAQRIAGDATIPAGWSLTGVPLCTFSTQAGLTRCVDAYHCRNYSSVISDGSGGAIVAWTDFRADTTGDIYAQRVLHDGTIAPGWVLNGVPLCAVQGAQLAPSIAPDGSGGAVVTWQDRRSGTNWDVYAQQVLASGNIAPGWPASGLAVCTEPHDQSGPKLVSDASGGTIIAWQDARDGTPQIYAAHVTGDGVVPVLVSLVSAGATSDQVRITWYVGAQTAVRATVYRRIGADAWSALGSMFPDGIGMVTYEDHDISPGLRYAYRLGIVVSGTEEFFGETSVDVPVALRLALEGLRPNPAGASQQVAFTLPTGSPATLELLDVTGRRLVSREVGSLGPGSHVVRLDPEHRLLAGVYWLRLTQGTQQRIARGAIVP